MMRYRLAEHHEPPPARPAEVADLAIVVLAKERVDAEFRAKRNFTGSMATARVPAIPTWIVHSALPSVAPPQPTHMSIGETRRHASPPLRTVGLCYTSLGLARPMLHRLTSTRRACNVQLQSAVLCVSPVTRIELCNRHRPSPTTSPFNVELAFATRELRSQCERQDLAEAEFGTMVAKTLRNRLADLRAARTLTDLIAGNPRWIDEDPKTLAVDLTAGYRMLLGVNHPALRKRSPHLPDEIIHRVKILRIEVNNG